MSNGVLAGFPVIGCKATLMDGAFHDVDSSVMAFEIAGKLPLCAARKPVAACALSQRARARFTGRQCARKGLKEAGAKLMEPMMKVEVCARAS